MSEVKVNKISPRTNCGTTTLGDSGDTFNIPSGVTISNSGTATGFGSTGEVSWNTTKITADPGPAVSGVGYFTDTSGAAFNITLPSSPSAGAVVAVADYANTWDTKALTILRNGSNIEGAASNFECNIEGASITFVYVDATKGWVTTNTGNSSQAFEIKYVAATGGTTTTCGDFKIHTFTGPGTFCVSCAGNSGGNNQMEYLVVAGGGSGGSENGQSVAGGGGGAGGFRFASPSLAPATYPAKPLAAPAALTATVASFPIAVGAGGSTAPTGTNPGSVSTFSTITAAVGGGGGFTGGANPGPRNGEAGGSGGGASHGAASPVGGGAGNTPPVSPPQGNNGGGMTSPGTYLGGGGGGAIQVGVDGGNQTGPGGDGAGVPTAFGSNGVPCGSYRYYAGGGGGGGSTNRPQTGPAGAGGKGGGAAGGAGQNPAPAAATVNSGGGGGGAGNAYPNPGTPLTGSAGGSGIVIIRYKFQN